MQPSLGDGGCKSETILNNIKFSINITIYYLIIINCLHVHVFINIS